MSCNHANSVCDRYTPTSAQSWAEPGDDNFFACWGDGEEGRAPPPVHEDAPSVHLLQDEWGTSTTAPLIVNPYTPTLAQSWAEHPPPPNEDAHSGDRLASIIPNDMLDAEDFLMDMLYADSILAPSRTISMTVASQVSYFVHIMFKRMHFF
jgi:hypothetical protein